jgi:hypothetical protein
VAGGDLLAIIVTLAVFVPNLFQWWVPAFVLMALGLSAWPGTRAPSSPVSPYRW